MSKRYEFTEAQEKEIGRIVADSFGAHFQTGFAPSGLPYLAWQLGPNHPVRVCVIEPDGTVVFDND